MSKAPQEEFTFNQMSLKEVLHYDPLTGVFTWLISPAYNVRKGSVAGGLNCNGYVFIRYRGRAYTAGRLAWLYVTGSWPNFTVDHWNRDRTDNSFANLRDVSLQAQTHNRGKPSGRNPLGLIGVTWSKKMRKWKSTIGVKGKNKHLGYFDSREDAYAEYVLQKKIYHQPSYTER